MKSPITKLAAAAVIIVAVLVGIRNFGGSIDLTSTALAETMMETMQKMPWMHVIGQEEGKTSEAWLSFVSKIIIKKGGNGIVSYTKYGENKRYVYAPNTETIYASDISGESFAYGAAGPLELFEQLLQMEKDKGAKVTQTKVEIWEVTKSTENTVIKAKLFIDIKKHLPIAMEIKATRDGTIVQDTNISFEYPENGPEDIYELGVPKSAPVVDGLPHR